MASMMHCVCQNAMVDLEQILDKIKDSKSFSDREQEALIRCLNLSVSIMEELGLSVEIDTDLSIDEAVNNYNEELE